MRFILVDSYPLCKELYHIKMRVAKQGGDAQFLYNGLGEKRSVAIPYN